MLKPNQKNDRILCGKILILLTVSLIATGCSSKTEIPAENIKVLAVVRTGVSMQSPKQIDRCREIVKTEVEQGRMSESLARELESVFALTEKGEWEQAEKAIINIQDRHKPNQATGHRHSHDH